MTLATRTVTLPGGLQATLVHQPHADRAAALARVAAGSHHEPSRFPGLAHLLEHLLFYGGERYRDDDRLMGWVQRQGGSVNATTLARHSAFFFEVAADGLADGVARLQEMLQAPRLLREDIQREVAVIDAEYRLIQQHEPSRREAAVRHAASAPAAFRRFQVGSADALAGDLPALQAALRDFHRTHYVARRMQLWLQGPQSLEALGELAARFAVGLAAGEAPPPAPPLRLGESTALQLAVSSQPALWRCPLIALSDNVTLLREFLLDEAPGSLMAGLRQRGQAQEVALSWLYQDRHLGWLALVFASDRPEQVDQQITHWLQALRQTTPDQQQHYYQLSRRRFQTLSPLDQLRQRAFGFTPGGPPVGFADFCAALQAAPTVSLACQTISPGEPVATQGFSLPLSRWWRRPVSDPALEFAFYPQAAGGLAAENPEKAAPLLHLPSPGEPPRLLLRPPFYCSPDMAEGLARGEQLRPLLAALRHAGGRGEWHRVDGSWQLLLQWPASGRRPAAILQAIMRQLALPVALLAPPPESIAIRHLMALLPDRLGASEHQEGWLAALTGGSAEDAQWIARQLSLLSARVNPPGNLSGPCRRGVERLTFPGGDTALLVFIPLPEGASLAALRVLAQRCEPLFFQRLRVEQQIGYVVSCRYQRVADRDGLLMALQSPDRRAVALLRCCNTFLRQLPPLDEATFRPLQQRLAAQVRARTPPEAQALAVLRQKYGLAELTPQAADALRVEEVDDLAYEMSRRRRRWRVLFTAGD
ncbi:TPA: pyrroloquinoline quinone biosynthesis protein PqqF [Klebsiella quasipneumoniae subsp. similipneumoniae]|uniref:pyrroloquinoline quinone biosynthesis protein PqqF n=1 Tax=Klebsiella quasipneumoniae TaxID=1463165 RepID=UPI000C7A4736|nr:pyrroloquinoline quinone biosynthesis protein PqqF [Klebsiella quasipneumoniae]PLD65551.1 coenzyme PQQ biosynthesis protein PqqF [Klebsiella quasipneumoniae]PLF09249.1 coenzyme PQQ biosynthesis protein PqqF [Klebsiella quasipneumoniae]HBR1027107.1 pyrroloquinoline quinone biosynthesis protein PqqF [Klebsiella quasipneumoniae subsp. similipneumoniae]